MDFCVRWNMSPCGFCNRFEFVELRTHNSCFDQYKGHIYGCYYLFSHWFNLDSHLNAWWPKPSVWIPDYILTRHFAVQLTFCTFWAYKSWIFHCGRYVVTVLSCLLLMGMISYQPLSNCDNYPFICILICCFLHNLLPCSLLYNYTNQETLMPHDVDDSPLRQFPSLKGKKCVSSEASSNV